MTTELIRYDKGKPSIYIDGNGDVRTVEDHPEFPDLDFTDDDIDQQSGRVYSRRVDIYQRPIDLKDDLKRISNRRLGHPALQDAELTPYEDQGGGMYSVRIEGALNERPLDEAIWAAKDIKISEVREAVERFGMNELTLEQYQALSETQKKLFILPFQKFYDMLLNHRGLIDMVDGRVELEPRLLKYHDKDESSEDVMEDGRVLDLLLMAINQTGIPSQVGKDLTQLFHIKSDIRRKALLKNVNYKEYQLTFKVDKNGQKKPIRDSYRLHD